MTGDEPQRKGARSLYTWGKATAYLQRWPRIRWIDLAILISVGGLALGLMGIAREWTGELRPSVEIDLSVTALPRYTLLSLSRGLTAYVLSLGFSLGYGYWAAKDKRAGRVLLPLLDVLQSIPVLAFMPGLVFALVAAFPRSNTGVELAAILMIFTGQAWNMTFSFYASLRSVPADLGEAATLFRFSAWERLRRVELPFATTGLVWNSMMSMAGGWFFLMISEAFKLGDKDFRLPGLGSYMSVAAERRDSRAMACAVVAMALMIIALDQLLWRPLVVWAQKFRVEDSGATEVMQSWFLELLQRSRLVGWLAARFSRERLPAAPDLQAEARAAAGIAPSTGPSTLVSGGVFVVLIATMLFGAWKLVNLLREVPLTSWAGIGTSGFMTLGRVLLATAVGTLWTVPVGLAIGLSPRLSRLLQPVVQIVASFPAPMLFPAVIVAMHALGISLGWGSIVLMLLGTQWYVLFNVVAGATAIPADLREAAHMFRMGRLQRFRTLYLPAVFPYLVTGWVTAAGGAWNASIVSEYVTFGDDTLQTNGLGARISAATMSGRFTELAASVVVMSLLVVSFNRLVWRRLNGLAETKYSLTR